MKLLLFEIERLKDSDWMMFFVCLEDIVKLLRNIDPCSPGEHYTSQLTVFRYNLHLQLQHRGYDHRLIYVQ